MKKYDLIVIGGGAGGLTVAAGSAMLGAKVALIEKDRLGGDCLWYGCVPSKAFIEGSKISHYSRKGTELGLEIFGEVDIKKVLSRVDKAIEKIEEHDSIERFEKLGVDVYIGKGSFKNRNEILIDNETTICGKRIIISTGSRPMVPDSFNKSGISYYTNETIFKIKEKPKTLLIVGCGPIGLELAQSFNRLGTEVHIIQRGNQILKKEDKDIADEIFNILTSEGLNIHTETTIKEMYEESSNIKIKLERKGIVKDLDVDAVLVATGRKNNIDSLNLSNAGVKANEKFIPVNQYLQTNIKNIYAIGDVNGNYPFTHVAGYEGKIVVSNALLGLRRKVDYRNIPWVTYTDPEIFHLGLTEKDAIKEYGDSINVYKLDLGEVDRFVTDRNEKGFIKLITDKKGYILGAHAIGKGSGDWMQTVIFAKNFKHKIGDLSMPIYPYPTHTEALNKVSGLYWQEKLKGISSKLIKRYIRWFR
ncbi:FAD-dependent oxidoreductase [Wukongibacter baidiensis]|uniref:dihydrolipoyl dehydrogenase family protein n=1 Tax=Wukongibacter baidiensis TaxID=1723361 RepID=UPI003D7F747A